MKTATALVPRAAKMLDRLYPNWHRKIKIKQFDIREGCYCITGQLGLSWNEILDLPITVRKGTLNVGDLAFDGWHGDNPDTFQEAWLVEIRNRKAADRRAA